MCCGGAFEVRVFLLSRGVFEYHEKFHGITHVKKLVFLSKVNKLCTSLALREKAVENRKGVKINTFCDNLFQKFYEILSPFYKLLVVEAIPPVNLFIIEPNELVEVFLFKIG